MASAKDRSNVETLIEVATGEEVPFKKTGHGFSPYSWK
jgi:hypothetical protein